MYREWVLTSQRLKRALIYRNYDSTAYWRGRAGEKGEAAVMFTNAEYNDLVRLRQMAVLEPYLAALRSGARILDIGCGIGAVAARMADRRPDARITAVDFPEMVARGRAENARSGIDYREGSAETYFDGDSRFDLVVSAACYSAIRDLQKLESGLLKGVEILAPGGHLVLIDPFHWWVYLARAKYSSGKVIRFLTSRGMKLVEKSGILYWPAREKLSNSNLTGAQLRREFEAGEEKLRRRGAHLWADYKVLIFRKP
jgi:SAM-dependent methyltransferase